MPDYKLITRGHFASGRTWSWAWHVTSGQPLATIGATWNSAVSNWWTNGTYGVDTLYPTGTILDDTLAVQLNGTQHYFQKNPPTALALAGTSADNGLPDKDSMVVSLRSPFPAKHQRGRSKMPAPVEGIVTNGEFTSLAATRMKNATNSVLAAINADGSTVYVFNPYTLIDGTPPYTKTVITFLEVALKVGGVRKRTKKAPNIYV